MRKMGRWRADIQVGNLSFPCKCTPCYSCSIVVVEVVVDVVAMVYYQSASK